MAQKSSCKAQPEASPETLATWRQSKGSSAESRPEGRPLRSSAKKGSGRGSRAALRVKKCCGPSPHCRSQPLPRGTPRLRPLHPKRRASRAGRRGCTSPARPQHRAMRLRRAVPKRGLSKSKSAAESVEAPSKTSPYPTRPL